MNRSLAPHPAPCRCLPELVVRCTGTSKVVLIQAARGGVRQHWCGHAVLRVCHVHIERSLLGRHSSQSSCVAAAVHMYTSWQTGAQQTGCAVGLATAAAHFKVVRNPAGSLCTCAAA